MIQFDESKTEEDTFYLPDGSTVETPMMQFNESVISENEFHYAETDGLKALKLPYTGEKISITFLLPENSSNGIDWLKNNVNQDTLDTVKEEFGKRKMDKIKIPKFEFEVKYEAEFKDTLQKLGMNGAFSPEDADFTGMEKSVEDLYISKAIHKAYIKVDEVGTEAAAVTAGRGATVNIQLSFVADHPFIFLIRDEETGIILFMGALANPQE